MNPQWCACYNLFLLNRIFIELYHGPEITKENSKQHVEDQAKDEQAAKQTVVVEIEG